MSVARPGAFRGPEGTRARLARGATSGATLGLVATAALSVVVAAVFGGLFTGHHALLLLVVAGVVPAATIGILRIARIRRGVVILAVAAAALAVYVIEAVLWSSTRHGLPTDATWSALGHGLHDGWKQLLTVGLPAAPTGVLEVTPVVLVWVAASVAALLATEEETVLAPIVPPLLALVIGLGFAAGGSSFPGLPLAVAFVAVAALLAATRSAGVGEPPPPQPSTRPHVSEEDASWAPAEVVPAPAETAEPFGALSPASTSRLGLAVPAVVVVSALSVGLTSLLPVASADQRLDPRKWVTAPIDTSQQVSPLIALNAMRQLRPAVGLFTVRVRGGTRKAQVNQLRVADLDNYDGAEWSSDGHFELSGSKLPVAINGDAAPAKGGGDVVVDVTVDSSTASLLGPYLPATGTPATMVVESPGRQFAVDPRDDQLAAVGRLAGLKYQLSAMPVSADAAALASAGANQTGGLAAYEKLPADPQVREGITGWAQEMTAGATSPAGQLEDLQRSLRQLPTSPKAAPGDSWGEINEILSHKRPADAAQLATAFALLARAEGFPARVAVGYLLPKAHPDAGTYQVTSADASAWPEVDLTRLGWVAFNPIGNATDRLKPRTTSVKTQQLQGQSDTPTQLPDNGRVQAPAGPGGQAQTSQGISAGEVVRDGSLALLALLLLVAVPPGTVVALKAIRRRRRERAASPALRILGAWSEVHDRLLEHQLAVVPSWSPTELAEAVDRHFDPTPPTSVNVMAPLVTSTLFAEEPPDDEEANRSWELEGLFVDELRHAGRVNHWRARVDPRPLLPNRVARRLGAGVS